MRFSILMDLIFFVFMSFVFPRCLAGDGVSPERSFIYFGEGGGEYFADGFFGYDSDPYFFHFSSSEYDEFKLRGYSKYGDLGFSFCVNSLGDVVVDSVYSVDPSILYNLETGDLILAVNDTSLLDAQGGSVESALFVPPGETVALTVYHSRKGVEKNLVLESKRSLIKTVFSQVIDDDFGYIVVSSFLPQTPVDLKNEMGRVLSEAGSGLRGWVFDLRNNPGGGLQSAVDSADLVLNEGIVSVVVDKKGDIKNLYSASPGDVANNLPIVVLINAATASAAELMVAALQENKRAIIMGQRSFGKDTIQATRELREGGAIKLTTARYLTPMGRSIFSVGIQPDIVVDRQQEPTSNFSQDLLTEFNKKGFECFENNQSKQVLVHNDEVVKEAVDFLRLSSRVR